MLLNRPSIFSKESVSSYIFRLARANYRTISVFLAKLGISRATWLKNSFSNEQLKKIAVLADVNISILEEGLYRCLESSSYYLKNRVKYCPDCYRESAIHRTSWGLIPTTICLQHNTLLLDTCLSCHTPIKLDQLMMGVCKKCKARFDQMKSVYIDKKSIIYEQQVAFQKSIHTNSKMLPIDGGFSADQFLLLAKHTSHLLEQLPSKRQKGFFCAHSLTVATLY